MIIRQATLADKPAIFEFLRQAYPGRSEYKFPHRWEWAFENNPFLADGGVPVWIALAPDGRVIGQSAALVEPLVVHGEVHQAAWGVDFHVLPEYRGQGIGTWLQSANNDGSEVFMSLSMAPEAAQIKGRLGLLPLPEVAVFTRILHHDPASVRKTLGKRFPWLPPGLRKAAAPPAARFLTARSRPSKPLFPAGLEIRREANFTEAFDRLWERVSPAFEALIRRDARYLTWKYRHQPHVQYEIWGAYRGGDLSGYAVLRRARPPERSAGILADLFADPADEPLAAGLIAQALQRFFDQEAAFVSAASSVPAFRRQLEKAGFKQTRSVTPLARAPFVLPDSGWLLARGDHDWDQYPLA